jgi:hypothetical protein
MQRKIAVPVASAVLVVCSVARAEQFVLFDGTYTHSVDTTNDSHYYPTLPADMPDDWTQPVDYAHGSVHIVLDVITKPAGNAPTKLQICFEGTPSYACTVQSPTYTTTGRVEWNSPFADFWYESTVDWSQGTMKMPLILKDDMNNKPAGNPQYMPTQLHVQVTLVSAGASFVPRPAGGSGGGGGAGTGGANAGRGAGGAGAGGAGSTGGASAAGRGGSGGAGAADAPAGGGGAAGSTSMRPAPAGSGGSTGTGASAAVATGGASGAGPASGAGGTTTGAPRGANADSGCRSTGAGGGDWALSVAALYLAYRRRRRPRGASAA